MNEEERELEEMRRLANDAYNQPVAARYERTLARYLLSTVDEVRRSHTEAAELRKRVGGLEGTLARFENFLEVTATYAVSKPKRDYAEFTLKTLRDDLSRSAAKQEKGEK